MDYCGVEILVNVTLCRIFVKLEAVSFFTWSCVLVLLNGLVHCLSLLRIVFNG